MIHVYYFALLVVAGRRQYEHVSNCQWAWGPTLGIWGPSKSWGPRRLPTLPTLKAGTATTRQMLVGPEIY